MVKRGFQIGLVSLLLLCGLSFAQSLANLAPRDTVLSLAWSSNSKVIQSLGDDLANLDWMRAEETLMKLAAVLGEAGEFSDFAEIFQMMHDMDDQEGMFEELYMMCPGFEGLIPSFEGFEGQHVPFDALLTVGLSAFSPIPSVTALIQIKSEYSNLMLELQQVMLNCAEEAGEIEVSSLDQDGVTLYVIGDAGDFPVVVGSYEDLFFAGSNPETLRGIIRKAKGASEESFADTRLAQEMASRFDASGNHLNFSLDLGQIADVAEGFADFVIDGPETEYLVTRGLSMLRTLGGVAGQISASSDGLVTESILTVNPEGGDGALLDLLICEDCKTSSPFLAASGAVSVSSSYLPWREFYTYLQSWAQGLEPITGERIDIKDILRDEFGFDLDVALFNWLGSEFHQVVLEPMSTDIKTLLYNPAQYMFVPVSSVDAAKAGIAQLEESFLPLLLELAEELDVPNSLEDELGLDMLGQMLAVRPYSYNGVEINRVQYSLNGDMGYGFVGNYLVLASPASALERAIDTYAGARTIMDDAAYMVARGELKDVSSFYYSNDQVQMRGLAEVLEVLSQPLAFGVSAGLQASLTDPYYDDYFFDEEFYFDEDYSEPYYADIYGIVPETISVPGSLSSELTEDDIDNLGYLTDFYQLTDLNPGDLVTVQVRTEDFDSYIWLIDAFSEEYLDENDDSFDDYLVSELIFTVEEGREYWVEISSYDGDAVGDYSLTVMSEPGMPEMSEEPDMTDMSDMSDMSEDAMSEDAMSEDAMSEDGPEMPSFANLLDFFDLLPATVNVFADHLSNSEGFSTTDGTTVYSRSLTRIRW